MAPPDSICELLSLYNEHCDEHRVVDCFKLVNVSRFAPVFPSSLQLKVHSVKWHGSHGKIRLYRIILSDGDTFIHAHPSTIPPFRQKLYRQIQKAGNMSIVAGKVIRITSYDLCHTRDTGVSTWSPSLILKKVTVTKPSP